VSAISAPALTRLLRVSMACEEARKWARGKTLRQAWAQCPRADWMLWLAGRVGVDRRQLVLAACACAETALMHVKPGEDRPRKAIETARAWCRGEATIEGVRAAADAAAAYAAYAAYADAAYAAYAAYADAADAAYAAYAAYAAAAAYAADDAAYADAAYAKKKALRSMAALVRAEIPVAAIEAAIAAREAA
jgi:hypothetical protein